MRRASEILTPGDWLTDTQRDLWQYVCAALDERGFEIEPAYSNAVSYFCEMLEPYVQVCKKCDEQTTPELVDLWERCRSDIWERIESALPPLSLRVHDLDVIPGFRPCNNATKYRNRFENN